MKYPVSASRTAVLIGSASKRHAQLPPARTTNHTHRRQIPGFAFSSGGHAARIALCAHAKQIRTLKATPLAFPAAEPILGAHFLR